MVRFQWHVADGLGAWMQRGGLQCNPTNQVTHASVEIEVGGLFHPWQKMQKWL